MSTNKYTEKEERALDLFNKFNTVEIDTGSSDLDRYIPLETAHSLHRKGCVTVAYKSQGEFKAVLTIWGKKVCEGRKENNSGYNESYSNEFMDERINEMLISDENEFKCICGKQMKNKSGFTLHQKKCKIYLKNFEKSEGDISSEEEHNPKKNWSIEDDEKFRKEIKSDNNSNISPLIEDKITKVEVGFQLILNGPVYFRRSDESEYNTGMTDNIKVRVEERIPSGEHIWLMCKAENSDVIWAVFEEEVISGKYKIFTNVEESEFENEEMKKDRDKFRESLIKFIEIRSKKLAVEKEFKKIDKTERPIIEDYTRKYGKESGDGKQDFVVSDSEIIVHLVRTPGKPTIIYKEDVMASWLMENGHSDCVKFIPDINMWNNLKAAGKVPPEIISQFEDLKMSEDKFALTIKEEK